ncbi:MAG: transposase, partial [Acidimicrobiales bacterium]
DHRRHAEVENTIRDLKYGVGLNHMPSGRFGANAAWLGINVIAHNMARWVSRIGLGESLIATDTLRRRYLRAPGRITTSARRFTLHLPMRWTWAQRFDSSLANLRASCSSPEGQQRAAATGADPSKIQRRSTAEGPGPPRPLSGPWPWPMPLRLSSPIRCHQRPATTIGRT